MRYTDCTNHLLYYTRRLFKKCSKLLLIVSYIWPFFVFSIIYKSKNLVCTQVGKYISPFNKPFNSKQQYSQRLKYHYNFPSAKIYSWKFKELLELKRRKQQDVSPRDQNKSSWTWLIIWHLHCSKLTFYTLKKLDQGRVFVVGQQPRNQFFRGGTK